MLAFTVPDPRASEPNNGQIQTSAKARISVKYTTSNSTYRRSYLRGVLHDHTMYQGTYIRLECYGTLLYMAEASVLISICTNLHSVRVDGTGHVSQFQTSRCRIRSRPKTKTIFHHIHFERDKSFMRSSVHYLRQSVKPRSDR